MKDEAQIFGLPHDKFCIYYIFEIKKFQSFRSICMEGNFLLVTSCQLLLTSYQLLLTSYQSLITSYQLLVTSYQLQITSHWLLVTILQSVVTSYQLLVTSHQLLVTSYESLVASHELLVNIRHQFLLNNVSSQNDIFQGYPREMFGGVLCLFMLMLFQKLKKDCLLYVSEKYI